MQIRAAISYGDYSEDKYSSVVLKRRIKNGKEAVREAVETSIKETDEMSRAERIQILPDSAGGWEVTFYDASVNRGWAVLLMGGAGAVLALAADERKIRDMCDERKKQMDIDHPGILNQYMLYFAAGMNTRAIWYSMCRRYEESLDPSGRNRRYAYDEMVSARNRMDEGCGEIEAYEEFAKRCDMKYRSFISLIKQAALKGNGSLSEQLYEEMEKALREKNNRVKTEASEAETKLLLPMFMMLAVVLAIVMIPAFIGLNG